MVTQQAEPPETGQTLKDAQKKKGFSSLLRTTKSATSGSRRLIPFANRRVKQPEPPAAEAVPTVEPPIHNISFASGHGKGHESGGSKGGDSSKVSSLTDRDGMNRMVAAATAAEEHNTQSSISSKSSAFSYSKVGSDKKKVITPDMKLFSKQTTMPQMENNSKAAKTKAAAGNDPTPSAPGERGVEPPVEAHNAEARAPVTSPTRHGERNPEPEEKRVQNELDVQVLAKLPSRQSQQTVDPPEEMKKEESSITQNDPMSVAASKASKKKSPRKKKKKKKSQNADARSGPTEAGSSGEAPPPPPLPPPSRKAPVSESEKKLAFERVRALLNRVNPRGAPREEDLATPRVDNTAHSTRLPVDPSPMAQGTVYEESELEEPTTNSPKRSRMVENWMKGGQQEKTSKKIPSQHKEVVLPKPTSSIFPDLDYLIKANAAPNTKRVQADPPSSPVVERKAIDAPDVSEEEGGGIKSPRRPAVEEDEATRNPNEDEPRDENAPLSLISTVKKSPRPPIAGDLAFFPDILKPAELGVKNSDTPLILSPAASPDAQNENMDENKNSVKQAEEIEGREIVPFQERGTINVHADSAVTNGEEEKAVPPSQENGTREGPFKFVFDEESSYAESPVAAVSRERSIRQRVLQQTSGTAKAKRMSSENSPENKKIPDKHNEVESSDDEIPAPVIDTEAMLAALESSLPPRKPSRASQGSDSSPRKKNRRKKSTVPPTEPKNIQRAFSQKANAVAEKHSEKKRLSAGRAKAEKRLAGAKAFIQSSDTKRRAEESNEEAIVDSQRPLQVLKLEGSPRGSLVNVAKVEAVEPMDSKQLGKNESVAAAGTLAINDPVFPSVINTSKDDPIVSDLENIPLKKKSVKKPIGAEEQARDDYESISQVQSNLHDHDRYAPLFASLTLDSPIKKEEIETEKVERVEDEPSGPGKALGDDSVDPEEPLSKAAVLADEITEWTGESVNDLEAVEMVIQQQQVEEKTFEPPTSPCNLDSVLEFLALDETRSATTKENESKQTGRQSVGKEEIQRSWEERNYLSDPKHTSVRVCEAEGVLELLALDDGSVQVSDTGLDFGCSPKSTVSKRCLHTSAADVVEVQQGRNDHRATSVSTYISESPTSYGVEATERQHLSSMRAHANQYNSDNTSSSEGNFHDVKLEGLSSTRAYVNPFDEDSTSSSREFFTGKDSGRARSSETDDEMNIAPSIVSGVGGQTQGRGQQISTVSHVSTSSVSRQPCSDDSHSDECASALEKVEANATIHGEPSGSAQNDSVDLPFDPTGVPPIDSEPSKGSGEFSGQESRDMSTVPQQSPESVDLSCDVENSDNSNSNTENYIVQREDKCKIQQIMNFGKQVGSLSPNTKANLTKQMEEIDEETRSILQRSIEIADSKALQNEIPIENQMHSMPKVSSVDNGEVIDLTSYMSMDEVDEAVWLFDLPAQSQREISSESQEMDIDKILEHIVPDTRDFLDIRHSSALDSVIRHGAMLLEDFSVATTERSDSMQLDQSREAALLVPDLSSGFSSQEKAIDLQSSMFDNGLPNEDHVEFDEQSPQVLLVVEGKDVISVVDGEDVSVADHEKSIVINDATIVQEGYANQKLGTNVSISSTQAFPTGRVWERSQLYPIVEDGGQVLTNTTGAGHSVSESETSEINHNVRRCAPTPEDLMSGSRVVENDDTQRICASSRHFPAPRQDGGLGSKGAFVPSVFPEMLLQRRFSRDTLGQSSRHPLHAVISVEEERSHASTLTEEQNGTRGSNTRSLSNDHVTKASMQSAESLGSMIHPSNQTRVKPSPETLNSAGLPTHLRRPVDLERYTPELVSLASRNPRDALSTGDKELEQTNVEAHSFAVTSSAQSDSLNQSQRMDSTEDIISEPPGFSYDEDLDIIDVTDSQEVSDNDISTTGKVSEESGNDVMKSVEVASNQERRNKNESSPREAIDPQTGESSPVTLVVSSEGNETFEQKHSRSLLICKTASSESYEVIEWLPSAEDEASKAGINNESCLLDDPMSVPLDDSIQLSVEKTDPCGADYFLDGGLSTATGRKIGIEDTTTTSRQCAPRQQSEINPTEASNFDAEGDIMPENKAGRSMEDPPMEAKIEGDPSISHARDYAPKKHPTGIIEDSVDEERMGSGSLDDATNSNSKDTNSYQSPEFSADTAPKIERHVNSPVDGQNGALKSPSQRDFLDYFFEHTENLLCGESYFFKAPPGKRATNAAESFDRSVSKKVQRADNTEGEQKTEEVTSNAGHRRDILNTVFEGAESILCLDDDNPNNCLRSTRGRTSQDASEQAPFAEALGPVTQPLDVHSHSLPEAKKPNVPSPANEGTERIKSKKQSRKQEGLPLVVTSMEVSDAVIVEGILVDKKSRFKIEPDGKHLQSAPTDEYENKTHDGGFLADHHAEENEMDGSVDKESSKGLSIQSTLNRQSVTSNRSLGASVGKPSGEEEVAGELARDSPKQNCAESPQEAFITLRPNIHEKSSTLETETNGARNDPVRERAEETPSMEDEMSDLLSQTAIFADAEKTEKEFTSSDNKKKSVSDSEAKICEKPDNASTMSKGMSHLSTNGNLSSSNFNNSSLRDGPSPLFSPADSSILFDFSKSEDNSEIDIQDEGTQDEDRKKNSKTLSLRGPVNEAEALMEDKVERARSIEGKIDDRKNSSSDSKNLINDSEATTEDKVVRARSVDIFDQSEQMSEAENCSVSSQIPSLGQTTEDHSNCSSSTAAVQQGVNTNAHQSSDIEEPSIEEERVHNTPALLQLNNYSDNVSVTDNDNRRGDPPTISDSTTQEISLESSNKHYEGGTTFESATYDDTVPSKPVILPDFSTQSMDTTREGVEVSIVDSDAQEPISDCLSLSTDIDASAQRGDPVATTASSLYRRRAIDPPSPRRATSILSRGLDPPTWEPLEDLPIPEDPPSGELGRAWSETTDSTQRTHKQDMLKEAGDATESDDDPTVVVVQSHSHLNAESEESIVAKHVSRVISSLEDNHDDKEASNLGSLSFNLKSSASTSDSQMGTDHSAVTDRVFNIRQSHDEHDDSIHSLQDCEAEETDEGVEVSIRPASSFGYNETNTSQQHNAEDDAKVGQKTAGPETEDADDEKLEESKKVVAKSKNVLLANTEDVDEKTIPCNESVVMDVREDASKQKCTDSLEHSLSVQSSGILERSIATKEVIVDKDSSGSAVFPLVAQLTDNSWCVGSSTLFLSGENTDDHSASKQKMIDSATATDDLKFNSIQLHSSDEEQHHLKLEDQPSAASTNGRSVASPSNSSGKMSSSSSTYHLRARPDADAASTFQDRGRAAAKSNVGGFRREHPSGNNVPMAGSIVASSSESSGEQKPSSDDEIVNSRSTPSRSAQRRRRSLSRRRERRMKEQASSDDSGVVEGSQPNFHRKSLESTTYHQREAHRKRDASSDESNNDFRATRGRSTNTRERSSSDSGLAQIDTINGNASSKSRSYNKRDISSEESGAVGSYESIDRRQSVDSDDASHHDARGLMLTSDAPHHSYENENSSKIEKNAKDYSHKNGSKHDSRDGDDDSFKATLMTESNETKKAHEIDEESDAIVFSNKTGQSSHVSAKGAVPSNKGSTSSKSMSLSRSETTKDSAASGLCANEDVTASNVSVSSEPPMTNGDNKNQLLLSRVERVRALAGSPGAQNFATRKAEGRPGYISSDPESQTTTPKNKARGSSRHFSRSPRLQNVLDRLRKKNPSKKGMSIESSSVDSSEMEPMDVDDLFHRYDNIVKNMVVNDEEKLKQIQERQETTVYSRMKDPATDANQSNPRASGFKPSPLIDVTQLDFEGDEKSRDDSISVSDLRASPTRRQQQLSQKQAIWRSSSTAHQPLYKSNSFSSASEFSVTPSQKARDLRQQLDQALQTSVAIRNSQEKLNSEISTFKSRLNWQAHLSPKSLSPGGRNRQSPIRSNSISDVRSLPSNEAYVSLAELQSQKKELCKTDLVLESFRKDGTDERNDLYMSPPGSDSEDDIRSRQVDSILTGLAQQTLSPRKTQQ